MYNQTKRKRLAAKDNIVRRRDNRQTILLFGVVLGLVGTCSRKTLQTRPNRKAIHRERQKRRCGGGTDQRAFLYRC